MGVVPLFPSLSSEDKNSSSLIRLLGGSMHLTVPSTETALRNCYLGEATAMVTRM